MGFGRGRGGGRGGGRGRGCGTSGDSFVHNGPDDATLIKQRNKIEKQLAEISALEKRRGSGEVLDANQLEKMHRRTELEESLRQVYLQGTAEQRERLGVCGNCGRRGHTTSSCPRPKAVQPKQAHAEGRSSNAPEPGRNGARATLTTSKARGNGSDSSTGRGKGTGGSAERGRGRSSSTDIGRREHHGGERRGTEKNRDTRSVASASSINEPHEQTRVAKLTTACPSRMHTTVESLVSMTGADRGVAVAALLSCRGDANAAAAAILTRQPAAASEPTAKTGEKSPENLVASMFSFKPPPKPDTVGELGNDISNIGASKNGKNRGTAGASKVAFDRHGLPLTGRGKGSASQKDREKVQTRTPKPEQPLVDDFVLIKHRNKIQKQLREITDLEKKRRSGLTLQPNQLAKLERQSEVEEMLRQVYLQGTSEQRERLGVCGTCGRPGHCCENCPRAVALEAKPMPLSASARQALEKAAEEPAEASEPNDFHYLDPVRLSLLLPLIGQEVRFALSLALLLKVAGWFCSHR